MTAAVSLEHQKSYVNAWFAASFVRSVEGVGGVRFEYASQEQCISHCNVKKNTYQAACKIERLLHNPPLDYLGPICR